jgi:hypothetical protein
MALPQGMRMLMPVLMLVLMLMLICRAGEDPVQALRQAAQLVRPGGKLVLLEHGSSSYSWLQRKLDEGAEQHFRKWGCRWVPESARAAC